MNREKLDAFVLFFFKNYGDRLRFYDSVKLDKRTEANPSEWGSKEKTL